MQKVFTVLFFSILITFCMLFNLSAQVYFEENFDYPENDLLTDHGWTVHSGTTSDTIAVSASGLIYDGYPSSGIGNAAEVFGTGIDINMGFTELSGDGTIIYFSALLRVIEAADNVTGTYFLHIGNRTSPTSFSSFAGRVFAMVDASGNVNFGLSNSSTATWSPTNFSKNTTYLLIVKYTISTAGNDEVSFWIRSSGVPTDELDAGTPELTITTTAGQDVIDAIGLRQAAGLPDVIVDGIRIGNTWNDAPLPVELNSFTANAGNNSVTLNWTTASESENLGYAIMRGMAKDGNYEEIDSYVNNNSLKGAGNSSTSMSYKFIDNSVMNEVTYWYKLIDVDYNGIRTEHGPIHATPRVEEIEVNPIDGNIPLVFGLTQNFPNPFNPSTTISFDIPKLNDGIMHAKIVVYDMLGQKVKTLLNSTVEAGHFEMNWNGTNELNQVVPSGIYVYQFQSDLFNASKKMVLMR